MHIHTYIDPPTAELTIRLFLEEADKAVLREHRNLRYRRVYDNTPRDYERLVRTAEERGFPAPDFNPEWVVTIDDLLGEDFPLQFPNFSRAKEAEEQIEKRIAQIDKEIKALHPEPEPPEPEPEELPEPGEPQIDEAVWYRHCLLIAQTGGGKTNTIKWRIRQLLPALRDGSASLIVLEPKGTLISDLAHMRELWEIRDRVVVIDPTRYPVGVNLFDRGDGGRQALTDALSLSTYVLSTLTAELTGFQRDVLTFAVRLMFGIDQEPDINTLKIILRTGISRFPNARVPESVREYFEYDFKDQAATARQIVARINGILAKPEFEALLGAKQTTINLHELTQEGRVILINANADALGESTELYGRFWIAQAYKSVLIRLNRMHEYERKPTTFIIDEAQQYIAQDTMLRSVLGQAREAKFGVMFAIHDISDVQEFVRGAIYTNTGLKFAARTSSDIYTLCRSMGNCPTELISTLPNYVFAFHSPETGEAIRVRLPLVEFDRVGHGEAEEMYRLSQERYQYEPPPVDWQEDQQDQSSQEDQPQRPRGRRNRDFDNPDE